jgi:branched-subunit amino acid aminotransferase/4-amino-4-deoxychorismate lyase
MIWCGGRIVEDDALKISVLDRTFEHGLGLFETLRTWEGRATLLDRHLARLTRSAEELGIPLDPDALPDEAAIAELVEAEALEGDVMLRITLSGGLPVAVESDALQRITPGGSHAASSASTLWMRAHPLPPPFKKNGAVIALGPWQVAESDPLARHKTLNYWGRRLAFERAQAVGYDEVISLGADGSLWEGSRTNMFVVLDQRREERDPSEPIEPETVWLVTPPADGPIVPGIMRQLVLEAADGLGMEVVLEGPITAWQLANATEVFLTNSVRGIIPVAHAGSQNWVAPGPWTQTLGILVADAVRGKEP